jgi:hypothetical protein
VYRLTKEAHFIPVKTTYNSAVLAELHMSQIVCLHGVPKKIVSDQGTQFTSHFWQKLHEALSMHLRFNSAYHPQKDGQTRDGNGDPIPDSPRGILLLGDGYGTNLVPAGI